MTVLAVIPARGGSKGVPRKNLRVVGETSLLARAVAACKGADGVDRVFVSTDDRDTQAAAIEAGAEAPLLRPVELATDTTPTLPVVQHAVKIVEGAGARIATVVLVEPTSPFRTAVHVAAALARFRIGDCRSVATVTPLQRKPHNIFVKDRYLRRYIQAPSEHFARRQDMAHLCRVNSAVYVVGRDDLMRAELLPDPVGWVEMDALSSLNVDSEFDLAFADYIAKHADRAAR